MPNWHDVFLEIQALQTQALSAHNVVRHKYLQALHKHTGRNIIAYYSGWLSKGSIQLSEINDEDKNGFMTTIHKLDRSLGLDLVLHTPGGGIAATQSIVNYLQKMFGRDIRAIVPQIAMSAGTIMACCCKEIWMGKQSKLGPIDPQLRGIPAHGVVQEFSRALKEVKGDPSRIVIWQQIIGQYRPTFLGQCENAIKWSNDFVDQQLVEGMFRGLPDRDRRAKAARKALSDYPKNKTHDRHFDADECEGMGLVVKHLENDPTMQDLVLTVHHCYMNLLMSTTAFKIIENQDGVALVKNVQPSPGISIPGQRGAEQPTLLLRPFVRFAFAVGGTASWPWRGRLFDRPSSPRPQHEDSCPQRNFQVARGPVVRLWLAPEFRACRRRNPGPSTCPSAFAHGNHATGAARIKAEKSKLTWYPAPGRFDCLSRLSL